MTFAALLQSTALESVGSQLNATIVGSSWGTGSEVRLPSVLPTDVVQKMTEPGILGLDTTQAPTSWPANENALATKSGANSKRRALDLVEPTPSRGMDKRPTFVALQEWEGVVTHVHNDGFFARLIDQTRKGREPDEEADFPKSEVSSDDIKLLSPGAVFRWSIGYLRFAGGTKQRTSQVVFRRLPQWSRSDIKDADAVADRLARFFDVDHQTRSTEGTGLEQDATRFGG